MWVVNGAKLGAGTEVGYVLKPIEPFDIFYMEGVNLYEVVCSSVPINDNVGKLIGGKPGKDSLNKFAIATKKKKHVPPRKACCPCRGAFRVSGIIRPLRWISRM